MTSFTNILNWAGLVYAITLTVVTITFICLLLVPVDIVTDWKIHVDEKTYHPGDEIVLHVAYRKVMEATGTSYYYLECEKTNGNLVRYAMSESEGNRRSGIGKIELPMKLSTSIPDLPNRCRVAVSVDYLIYTFRKVPENNESNWFMVSDRESKEEYESTNIETN